MCHPERRTARGAATECFLPSVFMRYDMNEKEREEVVLFRINIFIVITFLT
jgi:hypothetical protein